MTTTSNASFQRHNRGKYASLTWDDGTLGHGAAHALAELMDRTAAPALRAMYNDHRDQLPRTSTLYAAGANGYWIGCPRDLADEAERMVKAVQLVASLDRAAVGAEPMESEASGNARLIAGPVTPFPVRVIRTALFFQSHGLSIRKQETAMNMTELARMLGLSKGQVTKLAQRGMPLDDVQAAETWRAAHLNPAWMKRKSPAPAPAVMPLLDPVEVAANIRRAFLSRSAVWPIFAPAALSALLHEAGIHATDDQARRFAALLLVTWASYAAELVDGDELLFELPTWADDHA